MNRNPTPILFVLTVLLCCLLAYTEPLSADAPPPAQTCTTDTAVLDWLGTLSEDQRRTAEKILAEKNPQIQTLQLKIHQLLLALRALRYDDHSSPDTLPRLGYELQTLRLALRAEYETLSKTLVTHVGSSPFPEKKHERQAEDARIPLLKN